MLQTVRCWNCGKEKTWIGKEPKWFTKLAYNPDIIRPRPEKRTRTAYFCSRECMDKYQD